MCQFCTRTRGGRRARRAKVVAAHLAQWKRAGRTWTYFFTYSPHPDLGLRSAAAMHGWLLTILRNVLGPSYARIRVENAWWSVEAFKKRDASGRLRVHAHGFFVCPDVRAASWRRLKELFWSSGAGRLRLRPLEPVQLAPSTAYALKYMLKAHSLGRYTTASWNREVA